VHALKLAFRYFNMCMGCDQHSVEGRIIPRLLVLQFTTVKDSSGLR
jgi:hypothetical protein